MATRERIEQIKDILTLIRIRDTYPHYSEILNSEEIAVKIASLWDDDHRKGGKHAPSG